MTSFDDTWADASVDGNQDDAPPNGTYDVALIDADAFTSKGGNDVVKLEWRTVDMAHTWTMISGFSSAKAAGFTKGTCQKVGVNVDDVSSLEELGSALKQHIGSYYEVKVEHNGEFVNTYVNDGAPNAAGVPDVPADTSDFQPVPDVSDPADDDVPF